MDRPVWETLGKVMVLTAGGSALIKYGLPHLGEIPLPPNGAVGAIVFLPAAILAIWLYLRR